MQDGDQLCIKFSVATVTSLCSYDPLLIRFANLSGMANVAFVLIQTAPYGIKIVRADKILVPTKIVLKLHSIIF